MHVWDIREQWTLNRCVCRECATYFTIALKFCVFKNLFNTGHCLQVVLQTPISLGCLIIKNFDPLFFFFVFWTAWLVGPFQPGSNNRLLTVARFNWGQQCGAVSLQRASLNLVLTVQFIVPSSCIVKLDVQNNLLKRKPQGTSKFWSTLFLFLKIVI